MVPRPPMPQGQVGLQSAPPRPPGHPESPAAVQPGPAPMSPAPTDPNLQVPAQVAPAAPAGAELGALEAFLLARHPNAV